jgi:signal transduction histidine kinase
MFLGVCFLFGWDCQASINSAKPFGADIFFKSTHCVTSVAQFRTLSGADYLNGCDFHLTGVITLVDTNRDLLVLQDPTGAVALHFKLAGEKLAFGRRVTLDGTNCSLFCAGFPEFPYSPSGRDIQKAFEAPMNWGDYHLTRMRGFLRAPVTGNYRFWIASDNGSELWLSTDTSPAKATRIATIFRFDFVDPHQWSKYPSQRSDLIPLKAGEVYYIEALQEQMDLAENLSVGWQIPSTNEPAIDVIEGRYLTAWQHDLGADVTLTNGILREYWTNYTSADLSIMSGPRPFDSALSVATVTVTDHGPGELPVPETVSLSERLAPENNFRRVQTEGTVKFKAADDTGGIYEIASGSSLSLVHVPRWNPEHWTNGDVAVRVTGVCEGTYDRDNNLVPGLIWVSRTNEISLINQSFTNIVESRGAETAPTATSSQAMQGFYGTRGIVTFNDRVFDKDYVFIQENSAVIFIDIGSRPFKSQMKLGHRVDLGGLLEPGKSPPSITPGFVTDLGRYSMPTPTLEPLSASHTGTQEGKWSEIEGVVHGVNSNGTLSIMTKAGQAWLWLGQTPSNQLAGYVDAKIRARGALMMHLLETPVLLVPSRGFLEVAEPPPEDPFGMARSSIAEVHSKGEEATSGHRVHLIGEVTYQDDHSFFMQDSTGGIRVETCDPLAVKLGESVEAIGFPMITGSAQTVTQPLVRSVKSTDTIQPVDLDLSEPFSANQKGALIRVSAILLAQKTTGLSQVLELQEQRRFFVAILPASQGHLPPMLAGSRVQIIGVCNDEAPAPQPVGEKKAGVQIPVSFSILLRSPQDVTLLSGPPWWTTKKTVTLVGLLLMTSAVALLWVYLLRRRLERQRAAQLAFSRLILGKLEEERRRIAVNLHDSLGQSLLVIKNHAILANQSPAEVQGIRGRLEEISGVTTLAIEEVRRITHDLRPYQLDRLGLTQAIKTSVNPAPDNKAIQFASRIDDIDGLFDKDAEIHVYRIVQETVTNVVKHSAATEATVVIKRRAASISISVRDNGKGFDLAKLSAQSHQVGFGLTGIGERVRILNGTLTVDSKPGGGTSLTVEIPFKNP